MVYIGQMHDAFLDGFPFAAGQSRRGQECSVKEGGAIDIAVVKLEVINLKRELLIVVLGRCAEHL